MRKILFVLMIILNITLFAHEAKLIWSNSYINITTQQDWFGAKKYCKELTLENRKWRLPTFNEIRNFKQKNKYGVVKEDYYWSSTSNEEDKEEAYVFDVSGNMSCEGLKNSDMYNILCVSEK